MAKERRKRKFNNLGIGDVDVDGRAGWDDQPGAAWSLGGRVPWADERFRRFRDSGMDAKIGTCFDALTFSKLWCFVHVASISCIDHGSYSGAPSPIEIPEDARTIWKVSLHDFEASGDPAILGNQLSFQSIDPQSGRRHLRGGEHGARPHGL